MAAVPGCRVELAIEGTGDPHSYVSRMKDSNGNLVAECNFEWREDTVDLALMLGQIARDVVSPKLPGQAVHQVLGQKLYNAAFGGSVGEYWEKLCQANKRYPVHLVIRAHPHSARELARLPWEYLHDGKHFLALDWHTPISRLPWSAAMQPCAELAESLRMLVVISAPLGLSEDQILDTAREEDLILSATMAAQKKGQLEVAFAPSSTLEMIEDFLTDYDPHILHFVGHGTYDEGQNTGFLLLEGPGREKRFVDIPAFADLLIRHARSLRCVFLSACESAKVSPTAGFVNLGEALVTEGIPAVIAMQDSVFNRSAMAFGSVFYESVVSGKPLQDAVALAREKMNRESPNKIDFATPVLYLSDPACLRVDTRIAYQITYMPSDLSGVPVPERFVGRASYLRELQTHLDPENGDWRAAIIYGLGGMGKTALVARLATRMASRLDGVKAMRVHLTTTAKDILDQVAGFLLVNNAVFNRPAIAQLNAVKDQAVPLDNKAGLLVQILKDLKLLLILDNYEDVLERGQVVSQEAQHTAGALDPDLPRLIQLLIEGVNHSSKLVFTSRVDFSPIDETRHPGMVGHLSLEELPFTEAAYLMEARPPLDQLPISGSLSKRTIYGQAGGHPYTLNLLAKHAERKPVEEVLAGTTGLKGELQAFTLLEWAIAELSARARELLVRGAVYRQAVAEEGLAYLVGNEQDVMPEIGKAAQELVSWGLLVKLPGEGSYIVPAIVQRWAEGQWAAEERRELLCKAAGYWLRVGKESPGIEPELNAREYLFAAREYEAADEIVNRFTALLLRWGQYELLLRLLGQSVDTLQGRSRAAAMHNLAVVLQDLGEYGQARGLYEQSLKIDEELGDRSEVAISLHQLGNLAYQQGEYVQARGLYEQSLKLEEEQGNRFGMARTLHGLGNLAYLQGAYVQARGLYERSLKIKEELGDRSGVAKSLHQLGVLAQAQGQYGQARGLFEQSLKVSEELGDRSGVAKSLHQLAMLAQDQGQYVQARRLYEQSLKIDEELGDRSGVAISLHQLGNLAYQQGEYVQARGLYEQSLKIKEELGDRLGVASTLHQLAMLAQAQGQYVQARGLYEQVLKVFEELGDRSGVANTLHGLGMLAQQQGAYGEARGLYEQSLKIKKELGDRLGVARTLGQLGLLAAVQGDFAGAVRFTARGLVIFEQLGALERNLDRQVLARLREKMGDEAFQAALQAVEGMDQSAQPEPDSLQILFGNTYAVLRQVPEKRGEWWNNLRKRQSDLQSQPDLLALVGVLIRLVEGAKPESLANSVPEVYREDWAKLIDALSKKE